VPIIIDSNKNVVVDSWNIAQHLEELYPNSPSLFPQNKNAHTSFHKYADNHIIMPLFRLIILKIHKFCGPPELQDWYRKDREKTLGVTLECFAGKTDDNIVELRQSLIPVDKILQNHPFLTGNQCKYYNIKCTALSIIDTKYFVVGWADIVLASYFVFLKGLDSEMFEIAVLSTFGIENTHIRSWWKIMQKYIY
jgi:glutathione S-transferase